MPGAWVGLIFSMYSIAMIIVSPFIGLIVDMIGHYNLLAVGLFSMGTSIVLLGFINDIESDNSAIMFALFLRAIQGSASATINTSCFTVAANKYPAQTEFMVGMLEAVSGIGLIGGFLGGSYVSAKLGFQKTYWVFGGLLPIVAIITRIALKLIEMRERRTAPLTEPLLVEEEDGVADPVQSTESTEAGKNVTSNK